MDVADQSVAPNVLKDLVERFARNMEAYKATAYNETQTRREFLDPFFKALGWDIDNELGYAEAYKDVIHEDAIKIGEATKAPDYCFRIGGTRKFFLEAKKPAVDIRRDANPAFQLRRYGWTTKLPLSIVSSFAEFVVYDCRVKPDQNDKASTARLLYIPYSEYLTRWHEIADVFSRDSVLKGSFDKYAETNKAKRGTAEVDSAFLEVIEEWRAMLARNLALRNPSLTTIELNYAVQRTIDRILFLRICEDRGIEEYGSLRVAHEDIYHHLAERFSHADEKYNSGLFHFHKEHNRPEPPDELTLKLKMDDAPLKAILRQLYYPESPYEFSVLPADILGQVYEQFLGKVIRLTESHRAVVEYKPEVKKAGGVFYTPTYVVNHMTAAALKFMCEGKMPRDISALRVLDPACGSGSFLIVAYQVLLDWHLNWYLSNEPQKWATGRQHALYQGGTGGSWRLTTSERKRILLNNIFGVDVDAQAVETTKLSLLLKVLEGENSESVGKNLRLFHERALPDLDSNIKCGNSLISPAFYNQPELTGFTLEDRYRLNTFDYNVGFKDIMKRGFDVIIGNPPYVDIKTLPSVEVDYIFSHFKTANNRVNLFAAFIEKSLSLIRDSRFSFSMIVPTSITSQDSYKALRKMILDKAHIAQVVRLPNESFGASAGDVKVDTVILVMTNKAASQVETEVISYSGYDRISEILPNSAPFHTFVDQAKWQEQEDCVWAFNTGDEDQSLLKKCEKGTVPLDQCAEFCLGLTPYDKHKGHTPKQISDKVFHANHQKDNTFKKLLAGNDVTRYGVEWNGQSWISYGPWLGAPRKQRFFTSRRILIKQIIDWTSKRIWAALTDEELYNAQNAFNLIARPGWEPEYLLGILNSRLMTYYHRKRYLDEFKMRFQKILIMNARRLPIRQLDDKDKIQIGLRKGIIQAVSQLNLLVREHMEQRTGHGKSVIERQIVAVDHQIDQLVYALYGLNDEEVKAIELAMISDSDGIHGKKRKTNK